MIKDGYLNYTEQTNEGGILPEIENKFPVLYDAKLINANCMNNNVGIYFGNEYKFNTENIRKFTFWGKRSSSISARLWFANIFPQSSGGGNNRCNASPTEGIISVRIGNKLFQNTLSSPITFEDNVWHYFEFEWLGDDISNVIGFNIKIDGTTHSIPYYTTIAPFTDYKYTGFPTNDMEMYDIKLYNFNGDLIHHYPCSEGAGYIIYDTIGNAHGLMAVTTSNNRTSTWNKFQDKYFYNLDNTFTTLIGDDYNTFTSTLKVPGDWSDGVLIMKDAFWMEKTYAATSSTANCTFTIEKENNENYLEVTGSSSDDDITNSTHYLLTNFNGDYRSGWQSGNVLAIANNAFRIRGGNEKYRIKFKVRLSGTRVNGNPQLTGGNITFRCKLFSEEYSVYFSDIILTSNSDWQEIELESTKSQPDSYTDIYPTTSQSLEIQLQPEISYTSFQFTYDIKDIEVYRIDNIEVHNPSNNGINPATEYYIDFSNGNHELAEMQNSTLYKFKPDMCITTDPTMGASGVFYKNGWDDVMSANNSKTSDVIIYNGVWSLRYKPLSSSSTSQNRTTYIKNYDLSDEEYEQLSIIKNSALKAQAIQFTQGPSGSFGGSGTGGDGIYYRIDTRNLIKNGSNFTTNSMYAWKFKIHVTGWMKKIPTNYDIYVMLGMAYTESRGDPQPGYTIGPNFFNNNEWKRVDLWIKGFNMYYTANGTFGISCQPSNYANAGLTAAEAARLPAIAMADMHFSIEPEVIFHNDDLSKIYIYNTGNLELSDAQFQVLNNQIKNDLNPIIPPEYQLVEYIESDGNQYIDTGVNNIGNTLNIRCKFSGTERRLLSDSGEINGPNYWGINSSNNFELGTTYVIENSNGNNINTINVISESNKLSLNLNGDSIVKSGTVVESTYKLGKKLSNYWSNDALFTIYSTKIIENQTNKIIFYGYPCYRKIDKTPGMYDVISNTFLTNSGTGEFKIGNNINNSKI